MRPLHLTLKNFGPYADLDQDLSIVTVASLLGENGAGKSKLLEAIKVALYGRAVKPLDRLIRKGEQGFMLTYEFEANETVYRVVREMGKEQKASLFSQAQGDDPWLPVCDAKVQLVDAALERIVGCNYAEFCMAHHIGQGELGMFANIDPAGRKTWFIEHVSHPIYGRLEAAAKAALSQAHDSTIRLAGELDGLLVASEAQISTMKDELSRTEDSLTMKRAALESTEKHLALAAETNQRWALAKQACDAAKNTVAAQEAQGEAANERVRQAVGTLDSLRTAAEAELPEKRDTEKLVAELAVLKGKRDSLATIRQSHLADLKAGEDAIASLKHAQNALDKAGTALKAFDEAEAQMCPTCGQEVGGKAKDLVKAQLEETLAEKKNDVAVAQVALTTANEKVRVGAEALAKAETEVSESRINALEREISEARDIDEQHARRQSSLDRIPDAEKAHAEAVKARADLGAAIEAARADATRACAELDDIERIPVEEAEESKRQLNYEVGELLKAVTRVEEQIEAAGKAAARKEALEADVASLRHREALLALLVKAYGKSGIQARIIEAGIAEVEDQTNAFLERFADGMTVTFETQRENKGGGQKETLDINVTDSLGTSLLEDYSGGEKTRVYFALSIGLSQFLASHGSGRVESFVVDEPPYLDGPGLNEMLKCLNIIADTVPFVLLVSHDERAVDALPGRIMVRKGASGSKVEVTA